MERTPPPSSSSTEEYRRLLGILEQDPDNNLVKKLILGLVNFVTAVSLWAADSGEDREDNVET